VPDFLRGLLLAVALPILPASGRIDPRLDIPFVSHFYLHESLLTGRFGVVRDILAHVALPAVALALPLAAGGAGVERLAGLNCPPAPALDECHAKPMSKISLVNWRFSALHVVFRRVFFHI